VKGKRGETLRAQGQRTEATVFIGRGGLTPGVAAEVTAQLKSRALIKVKIASGAVKGENIRELAEALAAQSTADLVEVRGFTILLAKRPRARSGPDAEA